MVTVAIERKWEEYTGFSKIWAISSRQRVRRVQARSPIRKPDEEARARRCRPAFGSGKAELSMMVLVAMRERSISAGLANRRGGRNHKITGRSATTRGNTTAGTSIRDEFDVEISICSQQIWRRCPNGI